MSADYAAALLAQARWMLTREPRSQVDLRRAVSNAYYALFHFIVSEAARTLTGKPDDATYAAFTHFLSRRFDHSKMAAAAKPFGEAHAAKRKVGFPAAMVELLEAQQAIERAEMAIGTWSAVDLDSVVGRLFILSLFTFERLKQDR